MGQVLPEKLHFAIVDEADSILIDESRNPMIISIPLAVNAGHVKLVDRVGLGEIRDCFPEGTIRTSRSFLQPLALVPAHSAGQQQSAHMQTIVCVLFVTFSRLFYSIMSLLIVVVHGKPL